MKQLIVTGMLAGTMLLVGCGGGSSGSGTQSSTGTVGTAPVTPVTPVPPVVAPPPAPAPEPVPAPVTKPDFASYVAKVAITAESEEPIATDDIEFVFNDEDAAAFTALLESL